MPNEPNGGSRVDLTPKNFLCKYCYFLFSSTGMKYSTRQLFWITAVASDCASDLKRRYNTMVAHNSNFAMDFNCPAGSNMNVTEKCKMWIA